MTLLLRCLPWILLVSPVAAGQDRGTAEALLRQLKDPDAVVRLLDDGDARVRWAAVSALGSTRAKTYVRELSKFIEDRDPLLRWTAIKVLQSFEVKSLSTDFERLLSHTEEGIRSDAVLAVEL